MSGKKRRPQIIFSALPVGLFAQQQLHKHVECLRGEKVERFATSRARPAASRTTLSTQTRKRNNSQRAPIENENKVTAPPFFPPPRNSRSLIFNSALCTAGNDLFAAFVFFPGRRARIHHLESCASSMINEWGVAGHGAEAAAWRNQQARSQTQHNKPEPSAWNIYFAPQSPLRNAFAAVSYAKRCLARVIAYKIRAHGLIWK